MFSFLAKLKAETLVGLLIISGVGLVIYSAIRVTGLKDFKGEGNIIHAYFDDVAGLSPHTYPFKSAGTFNSRSYRIY